MMSGRVFRDERFVDYFTVVGLDPMSGLEPDKLSLDSLHCAPLARPYKSKVLCHYPDTVPDSPFDEVAIGMLCLPNGLQFITQRSTMTPFAHSFVITKEDGARIFGSCLTFYEIVTNRNILSAMQTLQSMHLAEVENDQSRTLYSHIPASNVRERTLERKKQSRHLDTYAYDVNRDTLYVTKCICLLTKFNFVECYKNWLEQLYKMICRTEAPGLALECYVYNLLFEIPAPKPGECLQFNGCLNKSVLCRRAGLDELPTCDYNLGELFMLLGIENVLLVFSCLLLENQILLLSNSYQRLMLVAEGITCLSYPFTWQHVYVPILPASSQHFLDAPVPFIMGLYHQGDTKAQLQLPCEANMCLVDIDNKTIEVPEDLAQFPNLEDIREEITEAFVKYTLPSNRNQNPLELDNAQALQSNQGSLRRGEEARGSLQRNRRGSSSSPRSQGSLQRNKQDILQQSEALQRVTAIAQKTGVIKSLSDVQIDEGTGTSDSPNSNNNGSSSSLIQELMFNNALREIFLNHFVHLFSSYESFVINTSQDLNSWLSNRDISQNFDKAAFLSDQPGSAIHFLSAFLETQMFTTFIDNKILSTWEEPDPCLQLFDTRIKVMRDTYSEGRPKYKRFVSQGTEEALLERKLRSVDVVAPEPHVLESLPAGSIMHNPGFLPKLNGHVLNVEPARSHKSSSHRRRRERSSQQRQHLEGDQQYVQEARMKSKRQPKLSDMSPGAVSKTNWKFVETLLKECKAKTKRMLVDKMGQEAVELGHDEVSLSGVEESTLIAGLCDLLERIWSHGLQLKQGKSALWSHLLRYQAGLAKPSPRPDHTRTLDPRILAGLSAIRMDTEHGSLPRRQLAKTGTLDRRSRSRGGDSSLLKPIPDSVLHDLKNVQKMQDLKTDIGYARAWVRLSLEKKLLCSHLQELLSDTDLLKSLYKRYAFLRCEDEREQFIFHLMALNAVDYYAFTNAYISTLVTYRVIIHGGKKFSVSTSPPTVWIYLSGTHRDTAKIQVPRNAVEFTFQHQNLGILTTLRVGHESSVSLRWMVDFIIVRNDITGHAYRFPCGRWLGRSVDDGSTERLLVAEQLSSNGVIRADDESEWTGSLPRHFIRTRSPSTSRRNSEPQVYTVSDIQAMLGDSVNNIVKHFHRPERERGSLTLLLCGEAGLVNSMKKMFQYGFKSARFLRNDYYIWDYLEKIQIHMETLLEDEEHQIEPGKRSLYKTLSLVISKIEGASSNVGKDGKFQTFVCIGVRDHLLAAWLSAMADTPVTQNMYEESSFLRNPQLLTFVIHILGALKGFHSQLEPSITRGVQL